MKESNQPLCLNQQVEDIVKQAHKLRSEAMRNSFLWMINVVKKSAKKVGALSIRKWESKKLNPLVLLGH